jgi:RNA polymerase sigma-70 factor (ECF subfamily)
MQYAEVELQEALSDALRSVSPRLSNAFVLRNVEDFSVRETADRLGLSVAAVKSRLVRARGRSRQRLRKTATGTGLEFRGVPRSTRLQRERGAKRAIRRMAALSAA